MVERLFVWGFADNIRQSMATHTKQKLALFRLGVRAMALPILYPRTRTDLDGWEYEQLH